MIKDLQKMFNLTVLKAATYCEETMMLSFSLLTIFEKKNHKLLVYVTPSQKLFNTLKCPTSCTLIKAMRRSSNFFPGEEGI